MPAYVSPSVRAEIDTFIESGRLTRLPAVHPAIQPPRYALDFTAYGFRPTAAQAIEAVTRRRAAPAPRHVMTEDAPPDEAVITRVGPCEAAPGSKRAERYSVWRVGATIGELRRAGLRLSDLRRDYAAGRIGIELPTAH